LRRLGQLIFSHLLPAPIQQKLAAAMPTDLVLRLDPQLVQVPWELACDGQEFLLTKFRLSRQVVTPQPARPMRTLSAPARLKLLIIVDPTERISTAGPEATQLHQALTAYPPLEVVVMGGEQLRKIDVLLALSDYPLVHFIGSTYCDASSSSRSGWVWPATVLTAAEFAQAAHPSVLVFANTCQAEARADGVSTRPDETHDLEVGSAFLRAGTPNYIGTFGGRHDRRCAALATDFYRHLLHGEPVGAALAAARQQARQAANGRALLWARYVHYGNLTFRLTDVRR
jgi:CHAT domain-containing protein